jgi:excinuclease ABC subunit A
VATVTEIYHYLRLLFVKAGVQHCPECAIPVGGQSASSIVDTLLQNGPNVTITLLAPLVVNRKGIYREMAQWAEKNGFPVLRVDGVDVPVSAWPRLDRFREHTIELPVTTIKITAAASAPLTDAVRRTLEYGKGVLHAEVSGKKAAVRRVTFSTTRTCPECQRGFDEPDPRLFSFNSAHGWCPRCFGTGLHMPGFDEEQSGEEIVWNEWWDGETHTCPACNGMRLNPEALAVKLHGNSIASLTAYPVNQAIDVFDTMKFTGREALLAESIVPEIISRLRFLDTVGLGYLTLDRAAPTLSGGEAQRVRLAAQLGSNLRGVCYILDEPTIGLHSRDNTRLIGTLKALRQQGNTVVVVEHDEETIRHADYLIDLGPGGGARGGSIIAAGTRAAVLRDKNSITANYLRKAGRHYPAPRPVDSASWITISRAHLHNLKNITVKVPLGRLVCVTGVSGSGKSTLVRNILHDNIAALLAPRKRATPPQATGCKALIGWEHCGRILEVDQRPIGKTPRSCPATYIGFWDDIRKIFARAQESLLRGYQAGRFSFNTEGGRCPACLGQGIQKIEMSFLPDVAVPCDACNGKRFNSETLAVLFKEKTIAEVLSMNVDDALPFFSAHPSIHRPLMLLQEVGLGYLTLGQQSPTLSGGEAQRIKLVTELSRANPAGSGRFRGKQAGSTLFVLDEPTVGLHLSDVSRLMSVIHQLVDAGNSVVVIEHNLDVIAQADWIIDLGPEGGDGGGEIVAEGTPQEIAAAAKQSYTGEYLAGYLDRSRK